LKEATTMSKLFQKPTREQVASLYEAVEKIDDVNALRRALSYCIHIVKLYDFETIIRMLDLPERCEETVPFKEEVKP
jgi:hypothetical protein